MPASRRSRASRSRWAEQPQEGYSTDEDSQESEDSSPGPICDSRRGGPAGPPLLFPTPTGCRCTSPPAGDSRSGCRQQSDIPLHPCPTTDSLPLPREIASARRTITSTSPPWFGCRATVNRQTCQRRGTGARWCSRASRRGATVLISARGPKVSARPSVRSNEAPRGQQPASPADAKVFRKAATPIDYDSRAARPPTITIALTRDSAERSTVQERCPRRTCPGKPADAGHSGGDCDPGPPASHPPNREPSVSGDRPRSALARERLCTLLGRHRTTDAGACA